MNIVQNTSITPIVPTKEVHTARKRFGQNFLIDAHMISRLVHCVNPKENDILIEIGPGLAALTRPLLVEAKQMTAIELDRDLLPFLSTLPGLNVINQDALKFDFSAFYHNYLSEYAHSGNENTFGKLRLVGNLPYNISTPIIFHLLSFRNEIKDMHFMLQKEVVDRMAALPDTSEYGRLSVMVQRYCQVIPLIEIPPICFRPAPKVMSQFVRLIPYLSDPFGIIDDIIFEKIVRNSFSNRRKMLRNNLKDVMTEEELQCCDINPQSRAETLSVIDFTCIANYVAKRDHHLK